MSQASRLFFQCRIIATGPSGEPLPVTAFERLPNGQTPVRANASRSQTHHAAIRSRGLLSTSPAPQVGSAPMLSTNTRKRSDGS